MHKITRIATLLVLFALPAAESSAQAAGSPCGSGRGNGLDVVGLTADQRLICFAERAPDRADDIGRVSGLMGGELLVGIDFRPADGRLFGLGSSGGVYAIDVRNAAAIRRSVLVNAADMTPVRLQGRSFGVDFNPVPDRLRITSDTGQNLRVDVDRGMTNVDGALNPAPAAGITGAAYINNDADPNTATLLYDIDTMGDQISVQSPPNAGAVAPIGKMRVDVGADVGFDIFSEVANGTTQAVRALASMQVGGAVQLFAMDLVTGRATPRGRFASNNRVIGIAIPLNQRLAGNSGNGGDDGAEELLGGGDDLGGESIDDAVFNAETDPGSSGEDAGPNAATGRGRARARGNPRADEPQRDPVADKIDRIQERIDRLLDQIDRLQSGENGKRGNGMGRGRMGANRKEGDRMGRRDPDDRGKRGRGADQRKDKGGDRQRAAGDADDDRDDDDRDDDADDRDDDDDDADEDDDAEEEDD
jgi:hypothetical protein